eukprot:632497-Amphidinium_carterae.1
MSCMSRARRCIDWVGAGCKFWQEQASVEKACARHGIDNELEHTKPEGIAAVAHLLCRGHRLLTKVEDLAAECNRSRRQFVRDIQAVAEASLEYQEEFLQHVVDYCRLKELDVHAGFKVMLVIHHIKYDETPMHIRGNYSEGEELHAHVGKVFVLQEEYTFLVRQEVAQGMGHTYTTLKGAFSPQMRLLQNGTGDSIAAFLNASMVVPNHVAGIGQRHVRIVETDECAANLRAEKIMASTEKGELKKCHIICSGHKAHQIASRCWDSFPHLHAGLVKALSFLKQPGVFQQFQDEFLKCCESPDFIMIKMGPLDESAVEYRQQVLRLFCPAAHQSPRAHAIVHHVSSKLLNGDWRCAGCVHHHCSPLCCQSYADTVQKLKKAIPRLLKALRVIKLESSNWQEWPTHLFFTGFLTSAHNLFKKVFMQAFGTGIAAELQPSGWSAWKALSALTDEGDQDVNANNDDPQGQYRVMLRVAVAWVLSSTMHQHLFLLRVALDPQIVLMGQLLGNTQSSWIAQEAMKSPGPAGWQVNKQATNIASAIV